ncbi:glycosyltransferase family 4 protein [Nodosilinea sp. FACHB-131]|uniref:glycosyltransferase family 4 protein n=1 Tax=Cyanophyceae TaxID=3028117 RepID=UPI00168A215E|nr:glycosyltransferase family 4 protein [Nodosilinea sp. FACHB-131]MBD1873995.1 glycosyltransferase family 4 protein [Nodosilinea sp. FACHB-131]
MRVAHITPTYFDNNSVIGGGERYPTELATWMSKQTPTTLVSFAPSRQTRYLSSLRVETYPVKHFIHGNRVNPVSLRYLTSVINADIVHIHNISTVVSDMACLVGRLLGKKVFVTDYGGGGSLVLNQKLPVFQGYQGAITYSQFGVSFIPESLQRKATLIKGGIDIDKFCPDPSLRKENKILYVGRLMPHKGINYLVDAMRLLRATDYRLVIIGRAYHDQFYSDLKEQAEGLPIEFVHDANDQRLINEYRTAKVTVLPSVHTTCYGNYTPVPELMGFTLLESQACGTPAICTDAGAMQEFVEHGQTGWVVEQNSGKAIAEAIHQIINLSPEEFEQWQTRSRQCVTCLNWESVVEQHLELYAKS